MEEDGCHNCRNRTEDGFCELLVVDTKRTRTKGGNFLVSNYIETREKDDDRSSFITPDDFKCNYHQDLY
jgi:hypothetical protein